MDLIQRINLKAMPIVDPHSMCRDSILRIASSLNSCKLEGGKDCARTVQRQAKRYLKKIIKFDSGAANSTKCKELTSITNLDNHLF